MRRAANVLRFGLIITFFPVTTHAEVLEQLIAAALATHPAARSQSLLLESTEAGLAGARWQFYPTPSMTVERAAASSSDIPYQGDGTVTTLRLQQPLWTGGRLTASLQKAQANVSFSQAALDDVRLQLALRVVQSYSDWLGAHLKIVANEKSLASHWRLHAQVKRRIEAGASSSSDLTLAVARREALASDLAFLHAQQDIALARLEQLLGRPLAPADLGAPAAPPHPIDLKLPKLLDQVRTTHPAVQKARAQAEAQAAAADERRADLSPEVFVRAERQRGNYALRNAPTENRLFIGVSSRFGAGLSTLSNVEAARAQYQAALEEIEVQGRAVSEQVLTDYALATSSESRLAALQSALSANEEISQSYDRQFLAGRKTWLDVMNAARELTQTELQLADTQSTRVLATWRLALHTGGMGAALRGQP